MACSRNCCRSGNYPGATACSNSARSFPSSSAPSPGRGCARHFHGHQAWSGVVLIGLAVFGFFTSLGISRVPAADPGGNSARIFSADLWAQIKLIRKDRVLWLATLGNTYFFSLGGCSNLLSSFMARNAAHFRDPQASYLALGAWHWPGQLCRGLSFRRQNRIRPDPAGFHRHDAACRVAVRRAVCPLPAWRVRLSLLGFLRRIFHRADCGVVAASSGPGKEGGGAGGRQFAFVCGHFRCVRGIICWRSWLACRRPGVFMLAAW